MNALRRQLSATGWQAVGFFGALAVFAIIAFFWGRGIEGDLDQVIIKRQQDHRVLRHLVHEAHPNEPQANSKSVQDLENSSGGEVATGPAGGGGLAPVEPQGDSGDEPNPGGGNDGSGSPADSQPVGSPPAIAPTAGPGAISPPPAAASEPEQNTPETGRPPSVLESAGNTVGEVLKGTGQVVEATSCGLTAPLLCPQALVRST